MAGYIGSKVAVVSSGAERKKVFTATSGQTSFTGLSYTVNNVHVFQNGVRLVDGTDYTATNGNSITLTVGAATDDQVVVVSYNTFQTSDTVSASTGGTFSNAVTIDADGSTVLTVDRATSDGTIIDVQKSGSSVGVIGANGSRAYMAGPQNGIKFGNTYASPCTNTGATADNAYDLGGTSGRWKDLYLSGGVVFGDAGGSGTSTSNTLDSYEEGTYTVGFHDSSSVGNASSTTTTGTYIKIGRVVTIHFNVINLSSSGLTGSSSVHFDLPFAVDQEFAVGAALPDSFNISAGRTAMVSRTASTSGSRGLFRVYGDDVTDVAVVWSGVNDGVTDFFVSLSYFTTT